MAMPSTGTQPGRQGGAGGTGRAGEAGGEDREDRADRAGRYHHGDLRAALIRTAIEVISERGVRGFSLAEASRRLGVAVSAPYAHFADREDLLAAVVVHAYRVFFAELEPALDARLGPSGQLAAMARGYVRFAAARPPLFRVMYEAVTDKARHPEIEAAEQPLADALGDLCRAICGDDETAVEDLACALEATAHGHVMLLEDAPVPDAGDVEVAAERAARAVLALIESRHLLDRAAAVPAGKADPAGPG
jgi:AcrR family transcriptional regulator